ncbi:hypothetical protein OH76DRAFT_1393525, partial [Lentinus brumalis]
MTTDVPTILSTLRSELFTACRSMSVQDLNLTVSGLYELLSEVKSLKNQGTLVHRLPNEILRLIFKHLLHAYRGRKTGVDTGTILRLTHVCRRWRDLLLGCPSFWARTGCFFAEGTRTFLERSGSAPL